MTTNQVHMNMMKAGLFLLLVSILVTPVFAGSEPTFIWISTSPNPSVGGQQVQLQAYFGIFPGNRAPTGSVQFYDNGSPIGSPAPLVLYVNGSFATIETSTLTVGTHSISAQYAGDDIFRASRSGTYSHVVKKSAQNNIQNPPPWTADQLRSFDAQFRTLPVYQPHDLTPPEVRIFKYGNIGTLLGCITYDPNKWNQNPQNNCALWAFTGALEIEHAMKNGVFDMLSTEWIDASYGLPLYDDNWAGISINSDKLVKFYTDHPEVIPWSNPNAYYADGYTENNPSNAYKCTIDQKAWFTGLIPGEVPDRIVTDPHYQVTKIKVMAINTENRPTESDVSDIKQVLDQGHGVMFEFFIPNSQVWQNFKNFWFTKDESMPWDPVKDTTYQDAIGFHEVLIYGYDDNDHTWLVLNSYGNTQLRPHGVFKIPQNMDYDAVFSSPNLGTTKMMYFSYIDASFAEVSPVDTSTTILMCRPSPSPVNGEVTLIAKVAPVTGNVCPTGVIEFYDGNNQLLPTGAVKIINGQMFIANDPIYLDSNGMVMMKTTFGRNQIGARSITAKYVSNNTNFFRDSTSAPVLQNVQFPTATSVKGTPNPSPYGGQVSMEAMVINSIRVKEKPLPTGEVQWIIDNVPQGKSNLKDGKAIGLVSWLSPGDHKITAQYLGDSRNAISSATYTQNIGKESSTIVWTATKSPTVYGEPAIFKAVVSASPPGTGTPTGIVQLWEGRTPLGTTQLDVTGSATIQVATLPPGTHLVTLQYPGDSLFSPSRSVVVSQRVNPADTSITLKTSKNPSVNGDPVTFTAKVSIVSPGSGTVIGKVSFLDGKTTLGTAEFGRAGTATLTTSKLAVATHSIQATYSGNANFNPSTSDVIIQKVQPKWGTQ